MQRSMHTRAPLLQTIPHQQVDTFWKHQYYYCKGFLPALGSLTATAALSRKPALCLLLLWLWLLRSACPTEELDPCRHLAGLLAFMLLAACIADYDVRLFK